jgi:L-alanine-DL-glutamate epimerase-like enolase superfamily enzyme
MIDTHGSLEVATAIKLAEEFASYDIAWFEEPVSPAWSTTKVWMVCRLIAEALWQRDVQRGHAAR